MIFVVFLTRSERKHATPRRDNASIGENGARQMIPAVYTRRRRA
jgi:hypothetical protein